MPQSCSTRAPSHSAALQLPLPSRRGADTSTASLALDVHPVKARGTTSSAVLAQTQCSPLPGNEVPGEGSCEECHPTIMDLLLFSRVKICIPVNNKSTRTGTMHCKIERGNLKCSRVDHILLAYHWFSARRRRRFIKVILHCLLVLQCLCGTLCLYRRA